MPYDVIGMALFSVSAITELVAEPLWVMGQSHHYVRLKVRGTVAPPPYDVIEAPLCQAEGKGDTVAPPPMMS